MPSSDDAEVKPRRSVGFSTITYITIPSRPVWDYLGHAEAPPVTIAIPHSDSDESWSDCSDVGLLGCEDDALGASQSATAAIAAPVTLVSSTPTTSLQAAMDEGPAADPAPPLALAGDAADDMASLPPSGGGSEERPRASAVGSKRVRSDSREDAGSPSEEVCVFCGRHTLEGRNGVMVAQEGLLFHVGCALWCPEVFYDIATRTLQNVSEAHRRSRRIKCAHCRLTGASLGCVDATCQMSFHLPCAAALETVKLDENSFELYCPLHALKSSPEAAREEGKDRAVMTAVPLRRDA